MRTVKNHLWQRLLKNGRVEVSARVGDKMLHITSEQLVATKALLEFKQLVENDGDQLPTFETKGNRRPSRGPKPLDGQLSLTS